MSSRSANEPNFRMLSQAVQRWYRHYGETPTDACSALLCMHAIRLYNEGVRSEELIASELIGTYVGLPATKINAPSSDAVH